MVRTYLKTTNLTKEYLPGKGAIDINIEIRPDEIVGFIGPNGAGKTTTMRMIMNLTKPDYGEYSLFGKKVLNEKIFLNVVSDIGFLPAEGGLYSNFTPEQLFQYSANLNQDNSYKKAMEMCESLHLEIHRKIKDLSTGNKRKIGVILTMMHPTKLLILDEPTVGLDPLVQTQIVQALKEFKKSGGSILFSSHVMSEVESVCDRIIMIKEGKIILKENTQKLLKTARRVIKIDNLPIKYLEAIKKLKTLEKVENSNGVTIIYTKETKEIIDYLTKNNIYNFWIERPSLEQMFMHYY